MQKREVLSMNQGWRFHLGDIPVRNYNVPGDKDILYLSAKTESSKGAGCREYDDSNWRVVDLPHDYVVEGTPTDTASSFFGSLERKNAWYRKTFKLDKEDEGKHLAIQFDGVCVACTVHFNGIPVMYHHTGNIGFEIDITDIARYGEDVNVISVFVDNSDFEGWYYDGGGIHRDVWLVKTEKVFVDMWGTYVVSKPTGGDTWESAVETEIKNIYDEDKEIELISEIVDENGKVVGSTKSEVTIPERRTETIAQTVKVSGIKRWDIDSPNMYVLKTTIKAGGEVVDDYETDIGYRTIKYTVNDGFFLNDRRVELIGYGSHQDHTGLGIGLTDAVNEYRMTMLKRMGFNLFRTAHNPHAPGLYKACNKLGLMCMDENRWFSSAAHVQDELVRMLKRDRNHPCIVMWSLYNEEKVKARPLGRKIFRTLAAIVHQYDATRPAMGCDDTAVHMKDTCDGMDMIGINHYYDAERIDMSRELYPDKPVFFSEVGLTPVIKRLYLDRPHMLGTIGWGGLPYRGETAWPNLFAGSDERNPFTLIVTPTDRFYWHTAYWTKKPIVKIAGHWNHKDGETVDVTVFTNYEKVELFLNGKSLGVKDVDSFDCEVAWKVPFEKGELKAVAYAEGKETLTDTIKTIGAPAGIGWELQNPSIDTSGMDTAIINLFVVDANGDKVPFSDDYLLKFNVKNGGKVICVGSPNRGDHHNWKLPEVYMCAAQAQVCIACDADPNPLELEVVCDAFDTVNISIPKKAVPAIPSVRGEDSRFIQMWYISPTLIDKPWPDIDSIRKEVDLNSWNYVEISHGNHNEFSGMFERFGNPPTHPTPPKESARVIYHANARIPKYEGCFNTIKLMFERFSGHGEVRLYGGGKQQVVKKDEFAPGYFCMDVEGFEQGDEVEIWVVLQAHDNYSSISSQVRWMFE